MFRNIGIVFLHNGQNDLGLTIDKFIGNLYMSTLIKLPYIRPMQKNKELIKNMIFNLLLLRQPEKLGDKLL